MPSGFAQHFIKPLSFSRHHSIPQNNDNPSYVTPSNLGDKEALQHLLSALNQSLSPSLVEETVKALAQIEQKRGIAPAQLDSEDVLLKNAIVTKLLVGIYAESVDSYLSQATVAETEAEWWADIERSRWTLSLYLLQTAPSRLLNLTRVIIQALRVQNIPLTLSAFTPSSIRSLFPSDRYSQLHQALFPHLRLQKLSVASSAVIYSSSSPVSTQPGSISTIFWRILEPFLAFTRWPIELTRQECAFKQKALEKIRDQRAEVLGHLAQMRKDVALTIQDQTQISSCARVLKNIAENGTPKTLDIDTPPSETLNELLTLSAAILTTQKEAHRELLESQGLLRPSRLTLLWPRLLLLPPLCIYALRSLYTSRATLSELASDAKATTEGFIRGWLIDPLKDVLKTVRTGSQDGVIVQKEGIAADIASLERMTLSLAKDQLNYDAQQLANLSKQVRVGNLTPVLQIYEEDIRSPLKSAVTGTLLRSVFIQIQKAKVDIDQTLTGIDKLLKSQELTFAFVGVAPAFGIVYLIGGSFLTLWLGGRGVGRYGGKRHISGVWSAMRRTERLLIAQPRSRHHEGRSSEVDAGPISPLTSGLLLLSVARLRTYAETHLPPRSRLREGFLEDVGDLENPDLGRLDKMKVIERMWRCWGDVLGWSRIAGEASTGR
ncbi:hypothetical protein H0H93_012752 [Arthromyces matolae]|nr:hypothetical protein H0H93_012752 [Arthromyces matolae]